MDNSRIFWIFLLLQPFLRPAEANLTTPQGSSSEGLDLSPTLALGSSLSPSEQADSFGLDSNGTRADCLIDTEMGLIALGSAGGLIICLLVATVVLAFQVWHLQRRVHIPRTSRSRSNLDLVDSAGYWGNEHPEAQGLIGPCDASVMLDEVGGDGKPEEEEDSKMEAPEEASAGLGEGAMALVSLSDHGDPENYKGPEDYEDPEGRPTQMEVPRDLENMPLVV